MRVITTFILGLLLAFAAQAQSLSNSQRNTLRSAVIADQTASALRTAGDVTGLLNWLNGASATVAWRAAAEARTLDEGAAYATFDSIAAGKRDAWDIFLRYAPRDMGKNKNRALVTDVWGNATAGSVAESVLQAATETATRAQAAIGGTSKSTGTVTGLDRTWAGTVSEADVQWIINN